MSKFGKNIKKIRNVRGLTQSQLADMLEVSRGVISSYEEGRAEPKIETILKTAEVFHLSTDLLLSSNVTVNQLSGFSLPPILQEPINHFKYSGFLVNNTEIFPDNVILISSLDIKANGYIKAEDVVFVVPQAPFEGKLFVVESKGSYHIGKLGNLGPNSLSLDHLSFSNKDLKGIFEVIGVFSPVKESTPLEERLAAMEQKIKLLEDSIKSK